MKKNLVNISNFTFGSSRERHLEPLVVSTKQRPNFELTLPHAPERRGQTRYHYRHL